MKILYLIRHAKSSKDIPGIEDSARPLNEKGRADARFIGGFLKKHAISIEAFYSSPAKRALDTAIIFAGETGFPRNKIRIISGLYDPGSPDDFIKTVKKIPNKHNSAAVFGHNPGILDFVNYLVRRPVKKFPTCGVFGIGFSAASWDGAVKNKGKIVFFKRPQGHR